MAVARSFECRVSRVEKSELPRTRIYRCKITGLKNAYITFDMLEDVIYLGTGRKINVLVTDEKPGDLESFPFCGKARFVDRSNDGSMIYSIGGFMVKIIEPNEVLGKDRVPQEFYMCIKT
ncbi:MAG: DNA-directed RNA polymerase subunit G [Desulfurococcales archaeon]|nr:DNA-directed RNA polymerase subunit G [Desulfurococcales archaeon]